MIFKPGGSKSISNRVLLIDRLCGSQSRITGLSDSQDTLTMKRLLQQTGQLYDAGPAGTCYRFMAAYLALQDGEQTLTGSPRMLRRPIGPLVDALRQLGAHIEYLEEEGFPPIRIGPPSFSLEAKTLQIRGDISSQFISALMMIGPLLPGGLTIEITGSVISGSYLEMTAEIMRRFGAEVSRTGSGFEISDHPYQAVNFHVEPDWSSASYPIGILAIAGEGQLFIPGLQSDSVQGDRVILDIASHWGVSFDFDENGLHAAAGQTDRGTLKRDFSSCPDLAPTVMAIQGALGIDSEYSGLEHLRIKESDRIEAMKENLLKGAIRLTGSGRSGHYSQTGSLEGNSWKISSFEDHRIAMAMSLWALKGEVYIDEPRVIDKSYPGYWNDLEAAGFRINLQD